MRTSSSVILTSWRCRRRTCFRPPPGNSSPAIRDASVLAAASDAELEPHRVRYWQAVKSYGADVAGKIFIDNHHLNATKFLTVPKLFPEARVIFAIRDPRDVVLSCFRLDFVMNPSTFELLTLERAARYYDSVMSLSRNYRRMFTLPWLDVRHETLVGDFKSEVERLCAFLDIEPHPAMENFAERAPRTRHQHRQRQPGAPAASTPTASAPGAITARSWRRCCRCWRHGWKRSAIRPIKPA